MLFLFSALRYDAFCVWIRSTRCLTTIGLCISIIVLNLFWFTTAASDEGDQIRVGVLKFGTVNWELDVIKTRQLAANKGVDLQVVPLASKSATQVAIQGGAVDVIVSDWIWVSRQRAEGRDYAFVPYSTAAGALMVDPTADITELVDLKGKRVGVAGGPVDKSWLILRAYSQQELGEDLAKFAEPNYAAPPLLNELALRKEIPAVLNFWHYAARLKAAGMNQLISVEELLPALGVNEPVPLVGWVFRESWAESQREPLGHFLQASMEAKRILAQSDQEWERLRPQLKVDSDASLQALRQAYRAGIPPCFGAAQIAAAEQVFAILAKEGGEELVGTSHELSEGTFWDGFELGSCRQ